MRPEIDPSSDKFQAAAFVQAMVDRLKEIDRSGSSCADRSKAGVIRAARAVLSRKGQDSMVGEIKRRYGRPLAD
jgi:hypothetical protein